MPVFESNRREFGTCLYGLGVWRFWTRVFEGTEFMCLCN